jgi:hypothetical protein
VLSWNLYLFSDRYLIEGRFDRVLVRPVDSVFQVLFEAFRLEALQETATGAAAVAWASHRLHLSFTALDVLLFVLWAVFGATIYLAIFIGLTATSFWIEDRIGIVPPVFNLMQFGRYPLTIYDGWIRFTLSFVVPFAFASFYPVVRFLRRGSSRGSSGPSRWWRATLDRAGRLAQRRQNATTRREADRQDVGCRRRTRSAKRGSDRNRIERRVGVEEDQVEVSGAVGALRDTRTRGRSLRQRSSTMLRLPQ